MTAPFSSYTKSGFMHGFTFGSALGTIIGGEILSLWVWWWFVPVILGVFVFGFLLGEDFASD